MKKFLLMVFFLSIILFNQNVFAQEKKLFIALKGGVFSPIDYEPLSSTNARIDFKNDVNFEFEFGSKINPNFSIAGAIGRYETDASVLGVTLTHSVMPITFTAKGTLSPIKNMELFLGGGIGYYFTDLKFNPAIHIGSINDRPWTP